MVGYTATKEIRKWEDENKKEITPIVAITAHAFEEHHQKSIDVGCTDHISKPIKKIKLLEVIYEYANV
jgi:CheY-like chemotaxis protein